MWHCVNNSTSREVTVCVCGGGGSEDNLWELVIFFYNMGPGNQVQAFRSLGLVANALTH